MLTREGPVDETRKDGVKTKSGCEDIILGQNLPPRGGSYVLFFGKLIGFGPLLFATTTRETANTICLQIDWNPATSAEAVATANDHRQVAHIVFVIPHCVSVPSA